MKKICILVLLTGITLNSFGQFRQMENYPTPDAASLCEYGKIPVNMYSGMPGISIPLYEVQEGNISLPISLNYNLAGVKPNVRSGWVGLGWSLSAGGSITRTVRSLYDEQHYENNKVGFYYNYDKLQNINNSNGLNLQNIQGDLADNGTFELMSDEYSFNFGEYSGNFYLNEDGQWIVVSDYDIKVEFDASTGFRTVENLRPEILQNNGWSGKNRNKIFFDIFTLITPDGFRYTFGGKYATEYSINYYNRNKANSKFVPTTWYLTKIQSPEGYEITLEYEAGSPVCEIQIGAFSSYAYTGTQPAAGGLFSESFLNPGIVVSNIVNNRGTYDQLSGYLMFPVYLKKITASYISVDFYSSEKQDQEEFPNNHFLTWIENRPYNSVFYGEYYPSQQFDAFMPHPYDGSKISQYLKWRTLKGISIGQRCYFFEYTTNSRKKLTALKEFRGSFANLSGNIILMNLEENKKYKFSYNEDQTFSRYIVARTDHWGYYNNTEERAFRDYPKIDDYYYSSRNASGIMDIAQAETLKEIVYPTGGKTVFTYQSNRYSKIVPSNVENSLIELPSWERGGGLCVSEISNYNENNQLVQRKKYWYSDVIPDTNSSPYYKTSGILKAKKHYTMTYMFSHTSSGASGYYALESDAGFMAQGVNQSDPYVSYSSVIEQTLDSNNNSTGYIRYRYTNFDTDIWGETHTDRNYQYSYNTTGYCYYTPVSSKSMERGKIVSEEYYNANNQQVKSIKYKYAKINIDSIKLPLQEILFIYNNNYYFAYMNYVYTYRYLVSQKTETEYAPTTGQVLQTVTEDYTYNRHKLLASSTIAQSDGIVRRTILSYPSEYRTVNDVLTDMTDRHILLPYIGKYVALGNDVNSMVISAEYNNFSEVFPGIFRTTRVDVLPSYSPVNIITWIGSNYAQFVEPDIHYKYDNKGNIIEIRQESNQIEIIPSEDPAAPGIIRSAILHTSYIWGYGGQYPIAEIVGMQYSNIPTDVITNFQEITEYGTIPEIISAGNTLRDIFPDAQISTYTFIPSIGMDSSTDPRGVTTYYEYDFFGRLKHTGIIEDGIEKTLKKYDYNYKQQ